ncbi:hypothetical protein CCHR01_16305 [Colletotrichum chrysophilum]|uniref:Uncharacterized protein n=1 Tax=Colletotrichum chrysophilum TaxID=1836956 RepID=A0AAD9A6N4_9PEZI|nr:hypothetical protein CCHR01_16305 [Colletotrichum chrysophilum]
MRRYPSKSSCCLLSRVVYIPRSPRNERSTTSRSQPVGGDARQATPSPRRTPKGTKNESTGREEAWACSLRGKGAGVPVVESERLRNFMPQGGINQWQPQAGEVCGFRSRSRARGLPAGRGRPKYTTEKSSCDLERTWAWEIAAAGVGRHKRGSWMVLPYRFREEVTFFWYVAEGRKKRAASMLTRASLIDYDLSVEQLAVVRSGWRRRQSGADVMAGHCCQRFCRRSSLCLGETKTTMTGRPTSGKGELRATVMEQDSVARWKDSMQLGRLCRRFFVHRLGS